MHGLQKALLHDLRQLVALVGVVNDMLRLALSLCRMPYDVVYFMFESELCVPFFQEYVRWQTSQFGQKSISEVNRVSDSCSRCNFG